MYTQGSLYRAVVRPEATVEEKVRALEELTAVQCLGIPLDWIAGSGDIGHYFKQLEKNRCHNIHYLFPLEEDSRMRVVVPSSLNEIELDGKVYRVTRNGISTSFKVAEEANLTVPEIIRIYYTLTRARPTLRAKDKETFPLHGRLHVLRAHKV
ncbi:MAG: hypothetical protein ABIA93_01135 [Candidatus Woesearchaeota archaeon]